MSKRRITIDLEEYEELKEIKSIVESTHLTIAASIVFGLLLQNQMQLIC